jgi:ATP-binding cassette, subfamily B, bacterial PglK
VRLLPDFKQMVNQINSLRYFRMSVVPVSNDLQHLTPYLYNYKNPVSSQTSSIQRFVSRSTAPSRTSGTEGTLDGVASPLVPALRFSFNISHSAPSISISNLTYTYPDGTKPVLNNISLTIPSGGFVGIAGPSGGGKTTLVDVLLGLLEPDSGTVLIDDMPLKEWLDANPGGVGYIPQTIFLCDDTLRRNVALGIPDELIDEARVLECIAAARLEELVEGLAEGLSTVIGERGIRLSGGQRQRIGIARALYSNPSLIVMDEATSALDSVTESEVMAAVELLRGSRTVLVIAHRETTLAASDQMIFINS